MLERAHFRKFEPQLVHLTFLHLTQMPWEEPTWHFWQVMDGPFLYSKPPSPQALHLVPLNVAIGTPKRGPRCGYLKLFREQRWLWPFTEWELALPSVELDAWFAVPVPWALLLRAGTVVFGHDYQCPGMDINVVTTTCLWRCT